MTHGTDLEEVAFQVGDALRRHGIDAVLTGGACAAFHSGGLISSLDVDFVLSGPVRQQQLDEAMKSVGFRRHRDRYVHDQHEIFVEFPRGPLAIGADLAIRAQSRTRGKTVARMLSPTDSCRDRLAAFFHWNDRQALEAAVAIARRCRMNWTKIRRWSIDEGAIERYEEFRRRVRSGNP